MALLTDYVAFGVDTHIGASSILMACPICASETLRTLQGAEVETALTKQDIQEFGPDMGYEDPLRCEFCGRIIEGQL